MSDATASADRYRDFDRRNRDWYVDKLVQALVFLGGVSAVVFIIGIFLFVITFIINLSADLIVRGSRK